MPKLHLKLTPEEEAARRLRKKEKKEAKRHSKRRRTQVHNDDEDNAEFIGPSSYKPDYKALRAQIEEEKFREKMAMAFEDDERMDSIEARLNTFAHVPMHWGGGTGNKRKINYEEDEFLTMDPMSMSEEEYVEWIRMGMYRKTHAQEIADKEQKKAERAAKRARDKAIQAETGRLEKLAAAERSARERAKESRTFEQLRTEYDRRWKVLLEARPADSDVETALIGFDDIPWPMLLSTHRSKTKSASPSNVQTNLSLEDFTRDAISSFLFTSLTVPLASTSKDTSADVEAEVNAQKVRKERLREAFLRFHPDKFEGRLMPRVKPSERTQVREALGIVVRVLNDLMGEG
ncbi:hypothetical protein D9757_000514 [Collybiopsis confluens]|uniref:Uncharacterized protein n=1 Tax=Collybiopsis confluens TaxID=2823264 RepID=A0A8H5I1T3_9AGAR|nr:hypothetical protein D9757_000514 [Collybiopsis confluens]